MEARAQTNFLLPKSFCQNVLEQFRKDDTASEAPVVTKSHFDDRLPPIEAFLPQNVSKEDRVRRFYELLRDGDILFCSIAMKNSFGLLLDVLCFASESGKSRVLHDLDLKCFCPEAEMRPADVGKTFEKVRKLCVALRRLKNCPTPFCCSTNIMAFLPTFS